jgi:hypothetical protein
MKRITRKAAKARGLARYFTGRPCKRGHRAERLVSNATCNECARAKRHRYNISPRGRRHRQRYQQSERYREYRRRHRRGAVGERERSMPLYRERQWHYRNSPKGHETKRRWRRLGCERPQRRKWDPRSNVHRRALHLERVEAIYRDNPTAANWTRLQNLYARRHRAGR